jgi:hypothetical protein
MIILKATNQPQTINIVPTRGSVADRMVIVNETTNAEQEYSFCFSTQGYYISFNDVLALEEEHFYRVKIYNGQELIHVDKIFCTNQETGAYSINKDEYVQPTDNIILYE